MTTKALNQARILQIAAEQAKKGQLVIVIARDDVELEEFRVITLSALPKAQNRRVFPEFILYESGGELHFRRDANLNYGRMAHVYWRRDDSWVSWRGETRPLKTRFDLMEEVWGDEA